MEDEFVLPPGWEMSWMTKHSQEAARKEAALYTNPDRPVKVVPPAPVYASYEVPQWRLMFRG